LTAKSEAADAEPIAVKKILLVGGQKAFEFPDLLGKDYGNVSGVATTKTLFAAYRYHLHFTVGDSAVEYIIDPKLMVK
jgi:hypothetical protein